MCALRRDGPYGCPFWHDRDSPGSLSRRAMLVGAAGTAAAATMGGVLAARLMPGQPISGSLYGPHQPGIVSPPLPYLSMGGFDLVTRRRDDVVRVLREWTRVAATVEAVPERAVTVTVGFGPTLFEHHRFGLAHQRPAALASLPPLPGEALDPGAGNGDLCVQACAASPTGAHLTLRALLNAVRPWAALRWRQTGYRAEGGGSDPPGLFGFRDGTANLDVTDPEQTAGHLWVRDGPAWLHGGTYLVMRRIRLLLDTWDRTRLARQETIIGRRRDSNAPVPDAIGSHAHLAAPASNGGAVLLRRSYSYDAGVDPNRLLDSGLIFLSFQRDPRRQFVPIQRRLAAEDPLNAYSQHVASGVYACPPVGHNGSFIGAELF